jgi:pimeloyl-ACP methyl ester carboxylesterase
MSMTGGPGGSSVDFLLDPNNRALGQLAVGSEHDIIGIDPWYEIAFSNSYVTHEIGRGVGRTTPLLRIFETEAEASTFTVQMNDDPYFGTSSSAIGRTLARYQGLGALAKARANDVAPYMSTPLVVRDLFAIMKAHGLDKLSYLGVSYSSVIGELGSILNKCDDADHKIIGMTFASMFPQNVGHIAIDGILDAVDYYSAKWINTTMYVSVISALISPSSYVFSSSDADKAMYVFYQACFKAGPMACAIHDKSPDAIKTRVDRTLERLKVQPLAASAGDSPGPLDYGVVDYGLVKNALLGYLYRPYDNAPAIASILAALEQGDANPMWQLFKATQEVTQCSAGHDAERAQLGLEPLNAIRCSDGAPVNDTLEQLQEWFEGNEKKSSFAGSFPVRVQCA